MILRVPDDGQGVSVWVDTARARGIMRGLSGMEQELCEFQVEHRVQLAAQSEPWAAAAAILASMSWALTLVTEKDLSLSREHYLQATMKYFLEALQDGRMHELLQAALAVETKQSDELGTRSVAVFTDEEGQSASEMEPGGARETRLQVVFTNEEGRRFAVDDESFMSLGLVVDIVHELHDVLEASGGYGVKDARMCVAAEAAVLLCIISYQLSLDEGTAGTWAEHLAEGEVLFNKVLHRQARIEVTTDAETAVRIREYLNGNPDMDLRVIRIKATEATTAFVYPAITGELLKVLAIIHGGRQGGCSEDVEAVIELATLACNEILWKASMGTAYLSGHAGVVNAEDDPKVKLALAATLKADWSDDLEDKVIETPLVPAGQSRAHLH